MAQADAAAIVVLWPELRSQLALVHVVSKPANALVLVASVWPVPAVAVAVAVAVAMQMAVTAEVLAEWIVTGQVLQEVAGRIPRKVC